MAGAIPLAWDRVKHLQWYGLSVSLHWSLVVHSWSEEVKWQRLSYTLWEREQGVWLMLHSLINAPSLHLWRKKGVWLMPHSPCSSSRGRMGRTGLACLFERFSQITLSTVSEREVRPRKIERLITNVKIGVFLKYFKKPLFSTFSNISRSPFQAFLRWL